jgi:hypothetical protein
MGHHKARKPHRPVKVRPERMVVDEVEAIELSLEGQALAEELFDTVAKRRPKG